MAGFRTFATGEVLTAANVNDFLMKQSVMVFADATARTAALGAEVTEGMLTFNLDTGALEVFDGSDFVPAGAEPPAGIGSNVVQTVKTDTFSASLAGGATTAITGLTVTITPSSATAKILVLYSVSLGVSDSGVGSNLILRRNTTAIAVGASDGTRTPVTSGGGVQSGNAANPRHMTVGSAQVLDSPGVATAVTYDLLLHNGRGITQTQLVNRGPLDDNDPSSPRGASFITVIEVAA